VSDNRDRLDVIARAMMDSRPELEAMSLDEWVTAHFDKLSERERRAAWAILDLYPEYGG